MEDKTMTRLGTFIILILLLTLAYLVLKKIIFAILFALVFAYILNPIYKRIIRYVKEKNTAASILLLIIIAAIAIPLWFLTPMLIRQTFSTYTSLQTIDIAAFLTKILPSIFTPELASIFGTSAHSLISKTFSSSLNVMTDLLVNLPDLLLQFAVFLFTFYFALRDSDKLKEYILKLSPFSPSTEKELTSEFRNITNAILYGQVLIGIIQGLTLGLGLLIIGFPNTLLLTFVAVIASIIPVLGSWLVWLPVSIYLIGTGQTSAGLFLLIYGFLLVSTIDNILRPLFLSKNSRLNIALGVIGTVGGLYYFGIIGLIIGPLVLAYILIILDLYREGKLSELFKK